MKLAKSLTIALTALVVAACAPRDTTHYLSISEAFPRTCTKRGWHKSG